jgi:DNA-binding NtrC family response regulator
MIDVSSAEGEGTVFDVYLPVVEQKETAGPDKTSKFSEYSGVGERILLVEDEKSARDVAVRILHMYGYKVHEAESAEKALESFEKNKGEFDLLFTDIVLPGMNGLDLATDLRGKKKDLPILMCSGYTDKRVQVEKIQEKNFRFLQKPYEIEELLRTIREII